MLPLWDFANNVSLHKHYYPVREKLTMGAVCDLIQRGTIDPKAFYSHVMPVEEFRSAVEMTASREAFKVILTF